MDVIDMLSRAENRFSHLLILEIVRRGHEIRTWKAILPLF